MVRLEGTNVDEGRKILAGADLPIEVAPDLETAAASIVKLVREAA